MENITGHEVGLPKSSETALSHARANATPKLRCYALSANQPSPGVTWPGGLILLHLTPILCPPQAKRRGE